MRLEFPKGTDPAAADALRLCYAAFPTFPVSAATIQLYLGELSKPGAARAASELALELDFFPTIGQIRKRVEKRAVRVVGGPPYLQPWVRPDWMPKRAPA